MKKQFSNLFALVVAIIMIVVLTGCGKAQQTDADNKFKLPLGDSGYLAEIDFYLSKEYTVSEATDTKEAEVYDFDYTNAGAVGTLTMSMKSDTQDGKAFKVSLGYYDNGNYIVYDGVEEYIDTLVSDSFKTYTYTFTYPETVTDHKDKTVIKLSFGTAVDEEYYKANNENAKQKDINKYVKKYRGRAFKIEQFELDGNNLLLESTNLNNNIPKENTDLKYYNTAVVSYASDVLTLKLNNKAGWWQWIIKELGKLLYWITNLVGGNYWLGLLIFTIVLRTAGWPIYAKTNSFSTNMSKIQPEMEKINKKYEGKTDQNSKMKQQMETRALMKKNHVSMWGCLLPFAQMPIFLAVYQVVQRFPLTPIYDTVNYKFLWTTFAMDYGKASGDWILAIVVGVTMIGSQLISTYMTKRIQRKHQNFYTAKNAQNNKTTTIMMIVMTVMMVVFAWSSAGIAFYWIIGNTYQIAQTLVQKLQEENREKKELAQSGKVRGR